MTRLNQPPSPDILGRTTTSTPAKPMMAAIQRSLRMGSPKNQAAAQHDEDRPGKANGRHVPPKGFWARR